MYPYFGQVKLKRVSTSNFSTNSGDESCDALVSIELVLVLGDKLVNCIKLSWIRKKVFEIAHLVALSPTRTASLKLDCNLYESIARAVVILLRYVNRFALRII